VTSLGSSELSGCMGHSPESHHELVGESHVLRGLACGDRGPITEFSGRRSRHAMRRFGPPSTSCAPTALRFFSGDTASRPSTGIFATASDRSHSRCLDLGARDPPRVTCISDRRTRSRAVASWIARHRTRLVMPRLGETVLNRTRFPALWQPFWWRSVDRRDGLSSP